MPVKLTGAEALRKTIYVPKPVTQTDFFINLPKFKAHPWCRLTLSLKNLIGIQDDRHRLVDHNIFLEHKIADLQEVIQSGFIAIDAIAAGQKMMLTPTPFQLGAIIMGTNSCAVDTVCCHMVHVQPAELIHLAYASRRGFGPMDIEKIEVAGNYSLTEIRQKTRNFQFCMESVDNYFAGNGNLTCTVGTFPAKHSTDYCWGGCPGALQEAVHILRAYDPAIERTMKKIHYVVGKVDQPLELQKDEKIIFAGNCTSWKGKIDGKKVAIRSTYIPPKKIDEQNTASNDMLLRTFKTLWTCFKQRNSRYIHVKGCPISVGDHVHYLATLAKTKNVNFDLKMALPVNMAYIIMRANRFLNRIFG